MGQGLHTKMLQVAATTLGIPLRWVRLAPTRTDKVPNTSATAASSGADLNGGAVKNACEQIRSRLAPGRGGPARHESLRRTDRRRRRTRGLGNATREADLGRARPDRLLPARAALCRRLLPNRGLHWDSSIMQGRPSSTSRTGRPRPRSRSTASPARTARGGSTSSTTSGTASRRWSTSARSRAASSRVPAGSPSKICDGISGTARRRGRLTTQAASTYKLPSFSEMPEVFNVTLLENATEEGAVYGSKAVGEPPLMLAFSVREALRQAAGGVRAARDERRPRVAGYARGRVLGGGAGPGCPRTRPCRRGFAWGRPTAARRGSAVPAGVGD